MVHFDTTDSEAAVYRIYGNIPAHQLTSIPQTVKSDFAKERDVPYSECRANLEEVGGVKYVVVAHCSNDEQDG